VAFLGAGLAPTALVWGLQHAGGTTGSLLLNLEAGFTALLAWLMHREPMGRRVLAALVAMAVGGVLLTLDAARDTSWSLLGALAVMVATLGWALDNAISRPLAELSPMKVVAGKATLGALLTGGGSLALAQPFPTGKPLLVILACGVVGYGISLHLYLLAQRRVGAARTASVFAVSPFIGAALAWALGDRTAGPLALIACLLLALGVILHATEAHGHPHHHEALEHEHPHRHDDGHHTHRHDAPVVGEHSHPHHHEALEHEHPHAPDLHHRHRH
jgi:drug/metabolite transporter (DMT)-like permease